MKQDGGHWELRHHHSCTTSSEYIHRSRKQEPETWAETVAKLVAQLKAKLDAVNTDKVGLP